MVFKPILPRAVQLPQATAQAVRPQLRRGAPLQSQPRQADAQAHGRGEQPSAKADDHKKQGAMAQLLKGAKLSLTGGMQAAVYERVARSGIGGDALQAKLGDKVVKAQTKAQDGQSLLLGALRGKKVDAGVTQRVAARDQRAQAKKQQKAERREANLVKEEEYYR